MPFYKEIQVKYNTIIYLWKITEDIDWYYDQTILTDYSKQRLSKMLSIQHQKGFLSVRMLLQHLGLSDFNLQYAETGKPKLNLEFRILNSDDFVSKMQHQTFISISHSHSFASIVVSNENIGLDLEIIKDKILKIAPRYMDIFHLEKLSEIDQKKKATIIWSVKEALFKIVDQKGISYPEHIFEKPFLLTDGKCYAWLEFENQIKNFEMFFYEIEDYVIVCGFDITK